LKNPKLKLGKRMKSNKKATKSQKKKKKGKKGRVTLLGDDDGDV
jgi:hypothetical protein